MPSPSTADATSKKVFTSAPKILELFTESGFENLDGRNDYIHVKLALPNGTSRYVMYRVTKVEKHGSRTKFATLRKSKCTPKGRITKARAAMASRPAERWED